MEVPCFSAGTSHSILHAPYFLSPQGISNLFQNSRLEIRQRIFQRAHLHLLNQTVRQGD